MGRGSAAQAAPAPRAGAGGTGLKGRPARLAGIAWIAAYALTIAVCEITRRTAGFPEPSDFALTPAALAAGKVWLLVTSAMLVSGPPLLELAGLVLAVGVLVRREGPAAFWRAAIGGHAGGTLIVYGAIGILWILARSTVEGVVHTRDYGVSSVWLGVLGAIFASILGDARRRALTRAEQIALATVAAGGVIGVVFFRGLAGAEHGTAFAIGAALQWASQRRGSHRRD